MAKYIQEKGTVVTPDENGDKDKEKDIDKQDTPRETPSFNSVIKSQNIPVIGVPLFGPSAPAGAEDSEDFHTWGIANLILAILGAALAVVMFPLMWMRAGRKSERESLGRKLAGLAWIAIGIGLAVISAILFFATESVNAHAVWLDGWTSANAVLLAASLTAGALGLRRPKG